MSANYFIVELRGIPQAVFSTRAAAEISARELSTRAATAVIVPVSPNQLEFDFSEMEEPTNPEPCLNDNYEVGSGRMCYCSRNPEGH